MFVTYLKKLRSFLGRLKEFALNKKVIAEYQQLSRSKKNKFIFLPSIEYHFPLFQRPQYLALELSKIKENFVLYLQASSNYSKWTAKEKINRNLYLSNLFRTAAYFLPNSWIYLVSGQAVNTVYDIKKFRNFGHKIIYDYVDEISEEISGDRKTLFFLKDRHQKILKERLADIILCTHQKLYEQILRNYPKERVFYLSNGVDLNIFNPKKKYRLPKRLASFKSKFDLVVGYHGAIAPWLDFKLINQLVKNYPKIGFVFIGLDYLNSLKNINLEQKNILYLGPVKYTDLPSYLGAFDVAWIPFKKGEIAKKTSPLKLYENLAMGLPVVASFCLSEAKDKPGVLLAKDIKDYYNNIYKTVELTKNKRIKEEIRQFVKKQSWEKKVKDLSKILKNI